MKVYSMEPEDREPYFVYAYDDIAEAFYYYLENEGITSNKTVTDLESWRRNCTIASTYSLLLTFEGNLTEEEKEGVRALSRNFICNSIVRLRNKVIPELQPAAREMLCEYWGKGYVEKMEALIDEYEKH